MKLLFAALEYDYGKPKRGESLEIKAFLPALKANFEDVVVFPIEKNGFPNDIEGLQRCLLDTAEEFHPDIIFFVLMKDEIRRETIKKLSEKYMTVNWFCDDQWRFDNYTKYIAPLFSLPITVDKYSLPKYKTIGCNNVVLSQWATFYDNNTLMNSDLPPPHTLSHLHHHTSKDHYKYDISFVGSKNATRAWIIQELKKRGIHVACFGAGWENGRISYDEMKDVFMCSKINLNLSNSIPVDYRFKQYLVRNMLRLPIKETLRNFKEYYFSSKRIEQMKARNFEIPSCRGFMLSQYCLDLESYYKIGKEIAIFTSIDELERVIRYYLMNNDEREQMKNQAYERSLHHTYTHRFKEIAEYIMQNK